MIFDLALEILQDVVLVGHLDVLFLLIALQLLNIGLEVKMLVLGKLELGLGLEAHILDLGLVSSVLAVNLTDLKLCIALDLLNGFLIVVLDRSDVVSQLLSRISSSVHVLFELL